MAGTTMPGKCQGNARAPSDLHWSHPCVLWTQSRAWCHHQSVRALCHGIPLWSLAVLEPAHPAQWIPSLLILCPPCTAPAQAAVTLSVRVYYSRCFHVCLHSCHWWSGGCFDCILFVCLFVCSDVWVLLPLFSCLFYLSPKQLVLFRS